MKVVSVSGIRGSGKTTLIRELIVRFRSLGRQSAVIMNEQGDADFDEGYIQTNDLIVERLRGG